MCASPDRGPDLGRNRVAIDAAEVQTVGPRVVQMVEAF